MSGDSVHLCNQGAQTSGVKSGLGASQLCIFGPIAAQFLPGLASLLACAGKHTRRPPVISANPW
jgi:hypothetical protein